MIYKKKEVLQMTHMYVQFCGYCFWSLSTCASVSFLNICLYYNNIEKPEKNGKYCLVCEALLLIDRKFDNAFGPYYPQI